MPTDSCEARKIFRQKCKLKRSQYMQIQQLWKDSKMMQCSIINYLQLLVYSCIIVYNSTTSSLQLYYSLQLHNFQSIVVLQLHNFQSLVVLQLHNFFYNSATSSLQLCYNSTTSCLYMQLYYRLQLHNFQSIVV